MSEPSHTIHRFLIKDWIFLKECGFNFRRIKSRTYNQRVIDELNMRQLDRLKMLLTRNRSVIQKLSKVTREGIRKNDPSAFATALRFLPTMSKGPTKTGSANRSLNLRSVARPYH